MKNQFIPLEKQSKRKQREYNTSRRKDWGGLNPVTRKPPNPKAYNRKKSGQRYEHEPSPGFQFFTQLLILNFYPTLQVCLYNYK